MGPKRNPSPRLQHPARLRWSVAATVLAVLVAGPASAQVIEELIVTAQKRPEEVQKVGVSLTAFSGTALKEFGFDDSTDIVAQVPGLNLGTPVGEGNNPSFTLRGVGLNDFNDNNEGPIAIYVDDVYQAALPGLTFQLFDVERVEVLRGPQGTTYGRNATGGLIHFISRKPTRDPEAFIDIEGGRFSTVNVEAAAGGGIAEGIRTRLSVAYDSRNGYVENRIGPRANEADSLALRGQVEFDVLENGLLNVKGFYSRSDTVAPQYQHLATLGATGAENLPFCPTDVARDIWCYADTDNDNFAGAYNRVGVLNIDATGVHATYTHNFQGFDLVNTFGYQNTNKRHEEDTDVGPVSGIEPTFTSEIDVFTNELRFSGEFEKGTWQVGGFYLDTKVVSANDLQVRWRGDYAALLDSDPAAFGGALSAFNPGFPTGADLVPSILFDVDYTQDTRSLAGFGQFEYSITPNLGFTGGIRYTNERRRFDYVNRAPAGSLLNNVLNGLGEANFFSVRPGAVNGFAAALGAGDPDVVTPDDSRIDDGSVIGKATIDWQATQDLLLYATWSRGFKAGGFNAGFLDQTDFIVSDQVKFDRELLTSYEAGLKFTLAGGRARINASGFYYDYEDFQALTFQGLSQFITNADASFYGGEAEIELRPLDGLDMQFGISLLDTDVDGVTVQGESLNNREAVLAPGVTANGFIRYGRPVWNGELSGTFSFNVQGSHFFDITNSAISRQDAYALFDLRLAYGPDSGVWSVAAFVENLTDKEYLVYTFDFTGPGGFNQRFFGPPRIWGLSASLRY